jgi:hypothetical protein
VIVLTTGHTTLTGLWSGRYWYHNAWDPEVEFVATMTEQDGAIGGWISEPDSITASGQRLSAFINGSAAGTDISFAKTYDGAGALAHRVDYQGVISDDRCTISGSWGLQGESGGFVMTRPALAEAEEEVEDAVIIPEAVQ